MALPARSRPGQPDRRLHRPLRGGQETPDNLAVTYNDRGAAWDHKHQYDRALQDFEAIRLDPKGANAYRNRANVYARMLQFDRAIQDYDQAIKLDPNDAKAFFGRGMMKKMKGDKAGGDTDMAHARQLDPNVGL